MIITKAEALAKLAANKTDGAEFDAATKRDNPGLTREQAVDLTLKALNLKRDKSETLATLKKQSVALKAKLAELKEIQAAIAPSPQRRRAAKPTPVLSNLQDSTPDPTAPSIKSMSLEAFNAMTPHKRMSFIKEGGKIK
jgi:hypothetical protein